MKAVPEQKPEESRQPAPAVLPEKSASKLAAAVVPAAGRDGPEAAVEFWKNLTAGKAALIVGESHNDEKSQQAELENLKALVSAGKKVALFVEYPSDLAPDFKKFSVSGDIKDLEFALSGIRTNKKGLDFEKQTLIFAQKNKIPIIPIDVSIGELGKLEAAQKGHFDPSVRELASKREQVMAETILEFKKNNPELLAVADVGKAHASIDPIDGLDSMTVRLRKAGLALSSIKLTKPSGIFGGAEKERRGERFDFIVSVKDPLKPKLITD